jgi:membrane protein YqaA with SNARE-associated domain
MTYRLRIIRGFTLFAVVVGVLAVTFYLAFTIEQNPAAQNILATIGYPGVFILALIIGLNPFMPVPAATFTPIFLSAHLSLPLIIVALTFGTIAADSLGYLFGHVSKSYVRRAHPRIYRFFKNLYTKHHPYVLPVVCFYSAFIPLPNELFLLPLAVLGMPFRTLLIPILIGDAISQTLMALGVQNIFWLLLHY